MARVRRTVVPKFIQINTQADYNKHIKPALDKGADAYGLEDIKGMWWELDDDTRLGAAKTMREIRDGIDKRPRIIFISGAGDERGITAMSLSEYAENMGLSVKDYLNGFTLESRNVMTAWAYLEELAVLEGMESRMEATEKILKALGYRKGPEDAWLDEDGSEIDVTDVLDNAEWELAVKVCGPLQESKNEGAAESNTPMSYVLAHKGPNDTTYCKNKAGDWTTHIEDAWDGSGPDSFSAEMKRNFADAVHCGVEDLEVVPVEKFESFEFDTPHFKPRTYEGEYILYVLYGLDKDGDETDELAWSKNADVLKKKIAAALPDYKDAYAGFHAVAICYDKNGEMRDSAVVWSADKNESNGADEKPSFYNEQDYINAGWILKDEDTSDATRTAVTFTKKTDGITVLMGIDFDPKTKKILDTVYSVLTESKEPAEEKLGYEKGHKNSRGENAPWVIRDHKNGKVLASFAKKSDAEAHLERMKRYSKNEASSRIVADNRLGKITKARLRDNTLAFYPLEDDGKDDDCIYFFKLDGDDIVTRGYQWGRDEVDYGMIAEDGYPWTAEPGRPTRDYVHTKKYAKYLLDRVHKCLDLGVATEKRHEDDVYLERMKHYRKNENSVMDWANKIKDAVANAAKAAGLEDRITASATNMPKLFVGVYQIGTMGDGINWEITGNLGVRRFDRQSVKRHWSVDSIEELEKSLTDEFQQLKDGKLNGKTEAISDSELLSRLKEADPEKGKYIIRAFHDSEGYWVWFPDEVSTYEPSTHTLHEYTVSDLLRAYKRSKIVGAKGESYERATKEIQARKDGQPWIRYAVTWPEYVDTYTKEAKERGWEEVRVIDLDGRGKHEALFNAKELEDLAMNGIKSAIMAAWSGAGVKNFKLDIQRNDYNLDVYSKTLDGVPTGTSWRVLPMAGAIARYADNLTNGSTEVVADIPYITDDDVERIFTDEFKKLDDDMSESYVNKEGNWGASNPDGFRKLAGLLEAAGFQCTFDDRFGDELVARDGEKFYVIEYNVPPDMVVDRNKPWEIFNGDSGEFMKNFVDPETAAAYLTAKKGKE